MTDTIWSCWFQGRDCAPPVVKRCLDSWELKNPGHRFRCLDATSIERYIPLKRYCDLDNQSLTAASLSDIVRILLLREFGGIWVDATLYCNRPLDDWLPERMETEFFAFAYPGHGRLISSWFLSADPDSYLVSQWSRRTIDYWSGRRTSDDYFWFHGLFRELCEADENAAAIWRRLPKISADGPHAIQFEKRPFEGKKNVLNSVDWTTPVFKLTHRVHELSERATVLQNHLFDIDDDIARPAPQVAVPVPTSPSEDSLVKKFAALKVSTENLGDHIQIIAGLRLLSSLGIEPEFFVDRDDELATAPGVTEQYSPVGILLNGWFKNNRREWPPHPVFAPMIFGFHIRLFQCPELLADASIAFFRRHEPVGCRDFHTERLLRGAGVEAFTSNCLSLTLPRRTARPETQSELFVVSRDDRMRALLPKSLGPYNFVSHYSGSRDFFYNMERAQALLDSYRDRAGLIVTTLLHCALPAIAMGIPVVVFYPINDERGHTSDRERFSALEDLVPIYSLDRIEEVDWNPQPVDVSMLKLRILDRFYEMATVWHKPPPVPIGPIAPATVLPAS